MVTSGKLNKGGSRFAPFKPRATAKRPPGPPKAVLSANEALSQNGSSIVDEALSIVSTTMAVVPLQSHTEDVLQQRGSSVDVEAVSVVCPAPTAIAIPTPVSASPTPGSISPPRSPAQEGTAILVPGASEPVKGRAIPVPTVGSFSGTTGESAATAEASDCVADTASEGECEANASAGIGKSNKRCSGSKRRRSGARPKLLDNFEDYDAQLNRDTSGKTLKEFCKVSYAHGKPMRAWFEKQKALAVEAKQKRAEEIESREVARKVLFKKRRVSPASSMMGKVGPSTASTDEVHDENAELLETMDTPEAPTSQPKLNHAAPQLRMVNGVWVFDADTLQVSHRAIHDHQPEPMVVTEESAATQMVNSATHMRKARSAKWTAEDTELLYEGLSRFGTDFAMITGMFCGTKGRVNIRNKFKREQKANPDRVNQALRNKKGIDIEQYSQLTQMEYPDICSSPHLSAVNDAGDAGWSPTNDRSDREVELAGDRGIGADGEEPEG